MTCCAGRRGGRRGGTSRGWKGEVPPHRDPALLGSFHRHATTATVSAITHVVAAHYTQHRSVDNHHMIRWSMVTLSRAQQGGVHLAGRLPLLAPRHGASTTAVPFVRSLVAPETGVLRELPGVLMQRNRLRCYFPSRGQEILFSVWNSEEDRRAREARASKPFP